MTSLVLGISSVFCLGFITGIPAAITGFKAHGRAKKQPETYGGAGMALTGAILGLVGTVFTTIALIIFMGLLVPAASVFLPALAKAKGQAQSINCMNSMKQIGLAARLWANDHGDKFPPDFLSMSNELSTPIILVCNDDSTKTVATDWSQFKAEQNASYEFLTPGAKVTDVTSQTVFRCPIHGNIGLGDGSVQQSVGKRR